MFRNVFFGLAEIGIVRRKSLERPSRMPATLRIAGVLVI